MKSLLDLQQDIRNLENNMTEITRAVKEINADIEEMRAVNQNPDIDYNMIEMLAKKIPFSKHPIEKLSNVITRKIYLKMLLNMVRLDPEHNVTINRLVFIQWLLKKSRLDTCLEDLYNDCYKTNSDDYYELVESIQNEYRDYFMVDLLIVANISGIANAEVYEYIAGIAAIFDIDKKRIRLLSKVAKVALCQQIAQMKREEFDEFCTVAYSFKYYIGVILLDEIKSMRQVVVEVPCYSSYDFIWKVEQGQVVKKDDLLASYYTFINPFRLEVHAKISPLSGTIFYFKDDKYYYGVIAHKSDDIESIKAWVKEKKKEN